MFYSSGNSSNSRTWSFGTVIKNSYHPRPVIPQPLLQRQWESTCNWHWVIVIPTPSVVISSNSKLCVHQSVFPRLERRQVENPEERFGGATFLSRDASVATKLNTRVEVKIRRHRGEHWWMERRLKEEEFIRFCRWKMKETGRFTHKIPGVHQLEATSAHLTEYGTHIRSSCIIHVVALCLLILLLGIRSTLLTLWLNIFKIQ